jgi:putative sigma-54 modulation protein
MRLTLTGRHIEVTDGLRRLVERKVARLERVLNTKAVSCQVELYMERFRHVAEVHLHARGGHLFKGRAVATSWTECIGEAADRIAQQGQTLKGKWETRKRTVRTAIRRAEAPAAGPMSPDVSRRIVRAKRYAVKPMGLDEAAAAVGQTPDAFVVFRNPDTDEVNVMFRRPDGDLGLIEPKA